MSGTLIDNWDISAAGSEGGNDDCVGITYDGNYLWTMDEVDEWARRFDANDGTFLGEFDSAPNGASSYGIAGNSSWVYVSAIGSQSFFLYEGAGTPVPDNTYPNVNTCTNLTIAGGNYTFGNNINNTDSGASPCISIQNDSITLDCNNKILNGASFGYGIWGLGINDTTIKNCEIKNS